MADNTTPMLKSNFTLGNHALTWTPNMTAGGGQFGVGSHWNMMDMATPLVLLPAVPILLKAPAMFDNVVGYNDMLQHLFERHATSITGIDLNYTLGTADTPAGRDTQVNKTPTNTARAAVSPSIVWPEITGALIWHMMWFWITSMADPDTGASRIAQITAAADASPQLFSDFSATMMFLVYERTMLPRNLVKTIIVTNMMPTETGEFGIKKEITSAPTAIERTIGFTGVVLHTPRIDAIGRNMAEALGIHTADWEKATPVADAISAKLNEFGINGEIPAAVADFVMA